MDDKTNTYKDLKPISIQEVISRCHKDSIEITWRTLSYYKSLGLLPAPMRVKGEKQKFYSPTIPEVLGTYKFFQNVLELSLKDIKEMVDKFALSNKIKDRDDMFYGSFYLWNEFCYGAVVWNIIEYWGKERVCRAGMGLLGVVNSNYRKWFKEEGIVYLSKSKHLWGEIPTEEGQRLAKKWADTLLERIKKRAELRKEVRRLNRSPLDDEKQAIEQK